MKPTAMVVLLVGLLVCPGATAGPVVDHSHVRDMELIAMVDYAVLNFGAFGMSLATASFVAEPSNSSSASRRWSVATGPRERFVPLSDFEPTALAIPVPDLTTVEALDFDPIATSLETPWDAWENRDLVRNAWDAPAEGWDR